MSANSWRQWLKLTKRQLKQIRQTLDDEIQTVLERNIPRPQKSLVRIPVSTRPSAGFRNGSRYIHTQTQNVARGTGNAQSVGYARSVQGGARGTRPVLSSFNGMYRAPGGVPRGLFSNWNMTTSRFKSGRAYSTSAIKITHDAVQNLSISLRCFYNLWDDFLPANESADCQRVPLQACQAPKRSLGAREVSTVRAMEVFRMIQAHKQDLPPSILEELDAMGCVVQFELPHLDMSTMPSMVFASDEALNEWRDKMVACHAKLRHIEESVRKIYEHYGALPLEFGESFVRVRFPNITAPEAEILMRDLGLTLGLVLPEPQPSTEPSSSPECFEYCSNFSASYCGSSRCASQFAPVLSTPSESSFSVLSSQG
ncbi:Spg5p [Lachancea thermotolerans CBS 6340]|uniref:KLTH0H02662p n=1 Tax=Lachancea thermotolerans (strain ATCC 56472 / CBS 6340 / NRRL Y-8284) TaxID=559295 RepID=C5E273_LACTC|nr:KLTH0H02662p [Lachancea thermotolerans CBS 6340]CAR30134.1 KLTH0H02662p [Lachancea thermotolerans CBS 6340]